MESDTKESPTSVAPCSINNDQIEEKKLAQENLVMSAVPDFIAAELTQQEEQVTALHGRKKAAELTLQPSSD